MILRLDPLNGTLPEIGIAGPEENDLTSHQVAASEVDAATWTAISLLAATSLGSLFYLGSRIDGLGTRMDGLSNRIDAHLERHASG